MRNPLSLILFGAFSFWGASTALQEPAGQDAEADEKTPFTSFEERTRAQLAEDIVGAWILTSFENPLSPIETSTLSGFASFQDGFMTLVLRGYIDERDAFGDTQATYVQAGAYRYRIDELGSLQTMTVLGFDNGAEYEFIDFEPSGTVREYRASLERDYGAVSESLQLVLRNADGAEFRFSQVSSEQFPEEAIRELDELRGRVDFWSDRRRR